MKGSELIKKAMETDMPDMEAVQKKCIKELHSGKGKSEKENRKKTNRKIAKSIYAGLAVCVVAFLCVFHLTARTGAESFMASLQTWLHLDHHERVEVGELQKDSIHIPEDCEKVEYGGETYLTKNYDSLEELEEDIGKHLALWRGVDDFKKNGIMLRIVEGEYASVDLYYDISEGEVMESAKRESIMQDLECFITIPLSEDFSMNSIKLKDQVLKDATLDAKGDLIGYARNGDYSILETYHSKSLDTDISVIKKKDIENLEIKHSLDTDYYYFYFIYKGLCYQINCNSNLGKVKSIVEELK